MIENRHNFQKPKQKMKNISKRGFMVCGLDLVASRNHGYIWHGNCCSLTISMSYKVGLCNYRSLFNKPFRSLSWCSWSLSHPWVDNWNLIACIVGVRTKLNQDESKLCLWLRNSMYRSFLTLNRDSETTNWVIASTQHSSCS